MKDTNGFQHVGILRNAMVQKESLVPVHNSFHVLNEDTEIEGVPTASIKEDTEIEGVPTASMKML